MSRAQNYINGTWVDGSLGTLDMVNPSYDTKAGEIARSGKATNDSFIAQNEVFGPVLTVIPFEDEADAIRIANDVEYGLIAAVWTRDNGRAHRVTNAINAGQVYINGYGAGGGVELPFGGMKKSGFGREKGFEALYDVTAVKTVIINHG